MTPVLIALGSNLGDRHLLLTTAWQRLGDAEGITAIRLSSLRETEPVGGPSGQPTYLNAVGICETRLDSDSFFTVCRAIETQLGRTRSVRWDSRYIDIDILLFGDGVIHTSELTIPHPRMTERPFVLQPAVEVAADWVVAGTGQTIDELWTKLQHLLVQPQDCGI